MPFNLNQYQALGRDFKSHPELALEDLRLALENGAFKSHDFSVKLLAEFCLEDGPEWVRMMDPRLMTNRHLTEGTGAVHSAQFSNITSVLVGARIMEAYNAPEFVFSRAIPTVPSSKRQERWPGMTKPGAKDGNAIEEVAEGDAYPMLTMSEDWIDMPRTRKHGGVIPITKEAILHDETGVILERAGEIGEAEGIEKEERIIDAIIDLNRTDHRLTWKNTTYATYAASGGHGVVNLVANNGLVDWTSLKATLDAQSQIKDPGTGKPIISVGSDIVVPTGLVPEAQRILGITQTGMAVGGYPTSGNPRSSLSIGHPLLGIEGYSAAAYRILSSPLLGARLTLGGEQLTNWYLGDITRSFKYIENWPIMVLQAPPNSELEFTHDIVARFKVTEKGAAGTADVRRFIKNTA